MRLGMNIYFLRFSNMYPEQYYAVDTNGNIIGYVRVRWGYVNVYYPDENSNNDIFHYKLKKECAGVMTFTERHKIFPRIKKEIYKQIKSSSAQSFRKLCISDSSAGEMPVDLIE